SEHGSIKLTQWVTQQDLNLLTQWVTQHGSIPLTQWVTQHGSIQLTQWVTEQRLNLLTHWVNRPIGLAKLIIREGSPNKSKDLSPIRFKRM
ncbi:hypothetical protein AB4455_06280, partial [Vibrio sp. 10N.261.46.E12]|uniref:hypothetical protein n=1 Tax=Vibrio sp. 10N.261.46.E12 TaxID=3229663 RepID=UPI00354C5763